MISVTYMFHSICNFFPSFVLNHLADAIIYFHFRCFDGLEKKERKLEKEIYFLSSLLLLMFAIEKIIVLSSFINRCSD